jgi:hypothetical protein
MNATNAHRAAALLWLCLLISALAVPQTARWSPKKKEPKVNHNFDDPNADHTSAAIKWSNEGQKELAERAFQSAAKFQRSTNTLANLGVCKMRSNKLDEAEKHMLEAYMEAQNEAEKDFVHQNLDNLAQHLAFREGKPIQGAKYRRRALQVDNTKNEVPEKTASKRWTPYDGPVTRPELLHQRDNPIGEPFPRKTVADLEKNGNVIRDGPFILTDGMKDWTIHKTWNMTWEDDLADLFPNAVTDFYPYNMLSEERQSPYLTRLPKGIKELMEPQQSYHFGLPKDGKQVEGRYMHLQLTPLMWQAMETKGLIAPQRVPFLDNDEWLKACMDFPSGVVSEEWHLKTHWKIILTGTRGAGMFNHSDALLTSSWHSQVLGRKWWYVCGRHDDGRQVCYEDIVKPGEILYYPRRWHHETQCVETPTMTLTDTVAHEGNAEGIMGKTFGECSGRNSLNFDFSSKLCDLLHECTKWWHRRIKSEGKAWHGEDHEGWRDVANPNHIKKLEETSPEHNNYDGRNYITEM